MLSAPAMTTSAEWNRPWAREKALPPIMLQDDSKNVSPTERQNSDPKISPPRHLSLPQLKRSVHVDPLDRQIQAMPHGSSDVYTKYLLSQDSPANSSKRIRLSTNPWFDLKGQGLSHSPSALRPRASSRSSFDERTPTIEDERESLTPRTSWDDGPAVSISQATTPVSEDNRSIFSRANSREPFPQTLLSRSPPSRQLPSPNSLHLQGIRPRATSLSPTTAHLHDLQHQLSTKSLAYSTLQVEHQKLSEKYSRSQVLCQTLEKKAKDADSDLGNAIEDRGGLQVQLEALEQQVTELQKSRDEAQKQSAANSTQYMQIMSMSSTLQAKSAADLKKYKSDREGWLTEKAELEKKVKTLEQTQGINSIFAETLATGIGSEEQDIADTEELATISFDRLKEELITLRRNARQAAAVMQTMREEGSAIVRLTNELGIVGQKMSCLGFLPVVDGSSAS